MSAAFKVGDRVTALPGKPFGPTETLASAPEPDNVGKTGVVTHVLDQGLDVDFPDGRRDYARFRFWAKADPVAQFPVGSRVRVNAVTHARDWFRSSVGKTGTVTEVFADSENGRERLKVRFDDDRTDTGFSDSVVVVETQPAVFTPGDVVTLKSGGPKMTVVQVTEYGVRTAWHLVTGEASATVFAPEALCRSK